MEYIQDYLFTPFSAGLFLGLLLTFFTWKSGFSARRVLKKEISRVVNETSELQKHLNTHLKIQGEGSDQLQLQLKELREQNETLRVNISVLQQKPGKAELRHLHIVENAVGVMREQAPGFAQAWEKALRQAEAEQAETEGGLKKLVKKILPALSANVTARDEVIEEKN